MSTENEDVVQAVAERRTWLDIQLQAAAQRLGTKVLGPVVNTFEMRSAGALARYDDADVWLRVQVSDPMYEPACRWSGNVEANEIVGVPKPQVLRWDEWPNTETYLRGRRLMGEVMTLAPGTTIAPDNVLLGDPGLPDAWWHDLRSALDALARYPIEWSNELGMVDYIVRSTRNHFGVDLPEKVFAGLEWTTAHADLHWGNLRGPELCILDWESWRPAPAGYDLATLYCNSLLHQPTAARIREMTPLQSRSGQIALLSAIGRYLWVVGEGSEIDGLEPQLRTEGEEILERLTQAAEGDAPASRP